MSSVNSEIVLTHQDVLSGIPQLASQMDSTNTTSDPEDWSQYAGLPFAFDFEKNFDMPHYQKWFQQNWYLCIYWATIYVIITFAAQHWMKNRSPFNLRVPLAIWSGALALFSIAGALRTVPEFIWVFRRYGFEYSACSNSFMLDNRYCFWAFLFTWSKLIEFGDTAFIVLRKQKLIALHWIHHALTLYSCFFIWSEKENAALSRWTVSMNYAVHAIMYSYYFLKALRFRIPKAIAMFITVSQIMQMVFGLWVNLKIMYVKSEGKQCQVSGEANRLSLSIYVLFFALFLKFFISSYFAKKPQHLNKATINNNHIKKFE